MSKIQAISDSEMEVMKIIWENANTISLIGLMEVLESRNNSWKKTTVQTFLSRLCDKNYVKYQKSGRNSDYFALLSEEDYIEAQTQNFLNQMYDGNAKSLIAALIKKDYVTTDDIEELTAFWKDGEVLEK